MILHSFVVTSSRQGRKNCLAVEYQIKKLLVPGTWALHIELVVPDRERPTFVEVAEDRTIPAILVGMDRKGFRCVSHPHRTVEGAGLVWHPLIGSETRDMKPTQTAPSSLSCLRQSSSVRN